MDISEFQDRRAAGTLTRRDMTSALAALGVAAVAYPVSSRRASADAGEVISFTWAGYDDQVFYQSYLDKYGAAPDYVIYAD